MRKMLFHLRAGTLLQTSRRWFYYRVWNANVGDASRPNRLHIWVRDCLNRVRYGKAAPQFAELIYINPADCLVSNRGFLCGQVCSGRVITDWPYTDGELVPAPSVEQLPIASAVVGILQSCLQHWRDGAPWGETWNHKRIAADIDAHGIFWMHRLRSREELDQRCERLDALFLQVSRERRLAARSEYAPAAFREEDTTMIHVGPQGELVVAGLGLHRFSIALISGLSLMPAQIGCVHRDALSQLPRLREERDS